MKNWLLAFLLAFCFPVLQATQAQVTSLGDEGLGAAVNDPPDELYFEPDPTSDIIYIDDVAIDGIYDEFTGTILGEVRSEVGDVLGYFEADPLTGEIHAYDEYTDTYAIGYVNDQGVVEGIVSLTNGEVHEFSMDATSGTILGGPPQIAWLGPVIQGGVVVVRVAGGLIVRGVIWVGGKIVGGVKWVRSFFAKPVDPIQESARRYTNNIGNRIRQGKSVKRDPNDLEF